MDWLNILVHFKNGSSSLVNFKKRYVEEANASLFLFLCEDICVCVCLAIFTYPSMMKVFISSFNYDVHLGLGIFIHHRLIS